MLREPRRVGKIRIERTGPCPSPEPLSKNEHQTVNRVPFDKAAGNGYVRRFDSNIQCQSVCSTNVKNRDRTGDMTPSASLVDGTTVHGFWCSFLDSGSGLARAGFALCESFRLCGLSHIISSRLAS